jgi:protein TonB
MVYGRREIAPKEQIKALRHARDRYAELADRIHNDTESISDAAERQLREDDARRIAKAYDRSLSNNVARLSGMEGTHRLASWSIGPWYRIGALLILAGLLAFAYSYAPARDAFLNLRKIWTVASNGIAPTSAPPSPSPAVIERAPLAQTPQAPQNPETDAHKPAAALATPAPRKIIQPAGPPAKKANPRETANAKPATAGKAPPETTATPPRALPTSALPAPAQAAPAQFAPAPPPASPQPVPPATAAPLPAPVETPAPPVTAAASAPVATPPAPAANRPEPITETHTLPRYPQLSAQTGEVGTTRLSVAITPQGQASDCRIVQSSGSERLDGAACAHVTDHWRWKPANRDSTAPAPRVSVTMVWNLSRPNRAR